MKVNCHIIGPFNAWWPSYGGHCEAEPKVIAAFDAGFRAGVLEARRRITRNGSLVGAATNDWFDGVAENGTAEHG